MSTLQGSYSNTLSIEMADEDIDFFSDVANRGGNDDIDIDIDLSTAHHDEDYMLEDVEPDADQDNTIVSKDDLMIDDENASFAMDDIDNTQEEHIDNLHMEDADLSDIHVTDFASIGTNVNEGGSPSLPTADFNEASEVAMDDLHAIDTHFHDGEEKLETEKQENFSGTDLEETEEPLNHTFSPKLPSEEHEAENIGETKQKLHPSSAEVASPNFNGDGDVKSVDNKDTAEISTSVAQIPENTDSVPSHDGGHTTLRKVIVIYRDTEYALLSTSESDDADSFFLKDADLIKEPIADFFAGLREVLLDDLAPEDELCLAAEDLGLEISEVRFFSMSFYGWMLIMCIRHAILSMK
jgi:hypothetical protein